MKRLCQQRSTHVSNEALVSAKEHSCQQWSACFSKGALVSAMKRLCQQRSTLVNKGALVSAKEHSCQQESTCVSKKALMSAREHSCQQESTRVGNCQHSGALVSNGQPLTSFGVLSDQFAPSSIEITWTSWATKSKGLFLEMKHLFEKQNSSQQWIIR